MDNQLSFWNELSGDEINGWDSTLLDTDASYRQYPYWNEPYRRARYFSPHYLVYGAESRAEAFACVVSMGINGFQVGLVQSGPVCLDPTKKIDLLMIESLIEWARERGYIFIRFSNSDPDLLDLIAANTTSDRIDAFPMYRAHRYNLLVKKLADEDSTLASFQTICRRKIKKATSAGYEIRTSDSPEELSRIWPIFTNVARTKGFRLSSRSLTAWMDLLRQARPNQLARLYTAYLNGECIQAILIIRYGKTAEYMIGALNLEILKDAPTPSCLLHWHAMRDFYQQGCNYYNLGAPGHAVYQFKRQFRPTLVINPEPVTVKIRPNLYNLWALPLKGYGSASPLLRKLLYRQARTPRGKSVST